MGDVTAITTKAYYFEYTTLTGYFVQDEPSKVGKDFDYVCHDPISCLLFVEI
jgi:hypothetical protein